jgi:hypothetical protein
MYTTTTDEAAVFNFVDSVATDADVRAFIAAGGADSATIVEIEKLYPKDLGLPTAWAPTEKETAARGTQWKQSIAFHTNVVETCSHCRTVDAWKAAGGTAHAARNSILAPDSAPRLGSHHSVELDYVFSNVDAGGNRALQNLAKLMSLVWASFVVHLDPNMHRGE